MSLIADDTGVKTQRVINKSCTNMLLLRAVWILFPSYGTSSGAANKKKPSTSKTSSWRLRPNRKSAKGGL